jgi:uncharacterized membrane-anchored protein
MKLKTWCLGLFCLLTLVSVGVADDRPKTRAEVLRLLQDLKYQHGQIALPGGVAKLNLPTNISYLDPKDADTVLVKLWGNPPGSKTLGMLLPSNKMPVGSNSWAVTIRSTEDGYVKDDEADKINYDDLLKKMQAAVHENNRKRKEQGYPAIELVGWAEPPHYDAATHKMYWARELNFEGEPANTLNYDIRILGRHGVLVLGAIASMEQLDEIRKAAPDILAMVDFNEGNRYTDFNPKVDKVATYGIAALVAGGLAAKLGFFKLFWIGLLAAKKFIIIGVVALSAWVRKLFKQRAKPTP